MIKHKRRRARSFAGLDFADFFQHNPERVRIKVGIGHKLHSQKTRLELLVSAVPQEGRVDAERNPELPELFFPRFGGRQSCRDGNRRPNDQLPRQLRRTVARSDMRDFVRKDRCQFVVVGGTAPYSVNTSNPTVSPNPTVITSSGGKFQVPLSSLPSPPPPATLTVIVVDSSSPQLSTSATITCQ